MVVDNIGGSVWNAPIVASDVDTEFLNQFCDMDAIPEDMAEEAYKCVHLTVLAVCIAVCVLFVRSCSLLLCCCDMCVFFIFL